MADNALAYGFLNLADLLATRVVTVGTERVYGAVAESAQEYSKTANAILSMLARRTTVAQEQIELPGSGTLQPLDAQGNPFPTVSSGSYKVAYPIQGGGDAWGTDRITRVMLTVEEANRFTLEAMRKDADWLSRHALAALFTNVTWTYKDMARAGGSAGLGDIIVQPLANSDTVVYARRGGQAFAVDSHYLAQAAAIADATNPFPAIRTELLEHPSNSGPLVAYVAPANVTAIGALSEFVQKDDPDIKYGALNDTMVANSSSILGPGNEILGKLKSSNIWIVEWSAMPTDYMMVLAQGAPPPLAMREYDAAELQGFFPEFQNVDGNREITRMLRFAGFGVRNRVSAVIQRVGNGSYAVPTGFLAPLAV